MSAFVSTSKEEALPRSTPDPGTLLTTTSGAVNPTKKVGFKVEQSRDSGDAISSGRPAYLFFSLALADFQFLRRRGQEDLCREQADFPAPR